MRNSTHRAHQVARAVGRIAHRAASVVAECNYAQNRLTQIRLIPDSYACDSQHRSR
jgi:hypothetical protein